MMSSESNATPLCVSVIMPVYNGVEFITKSLPPIIEMLNRDEVLEVIVVDDGSTDDSMKLARDMGAQVITSGGRLGPGGARNQAANSAKGDILWFVDADVVVHDDAAQYLVPNFEEPDVVAVFGSYDDEPSANNFLSQYKNLVHHYYHHGARREASTFWAGCGAVRKKAFLDVNGFDVERYSRPSIEDIELGYRLREAGGRILVLPEMKGTHLKVWRLFNLIHTEIFCRAIPWSQLMLSRSGLVDDLNVGVRERVRAVLAGALMLSIFAAIISFSSPWLVVIMFVIVLISNGSLVKFFYRKKSWFFAIGGLLFHQIYYVYSSAAFAWCWIRNKVGKFKNVAA